MYVIQSTHWFINYYRFFVPLYQFIIYSFCKVLKYLVLEGKLCVPLCDRYQLNIHYCCPLTEAESVTKDCASTHSHLQSGQATLQKLVGILSCVCVATFHHNKMICQMERRQDVTLDIKHRHAALEVQWVKHLISDDEMLKALAYYHINASIDNSILWECNLNTNDVSQSGCKIPFWQCVVLSWASVNYNEPNME